MRQKVIIIVLAILSSFACAAGISACGTNNDTHTHEWAETWSSDETYHWHKCLGCDEITEKSEHDFSNGDCICGKEKPIEGHNHEFSVKVTEDKYLKSEATCTAKAQYYYSCECGEKGTATFEFGELKEHNFSSETVEEKYLKSEATCIDLAKYYKSCSVCGEVGAETFEYGELKEHNFVDGLCEYCGKGYLNMALNGNSYTVEGLQEEYKSLQEIIIPSLYCGLPVTSIKSSAFKNCNNITKLTVSESVTEIGSSAFEGCNGLKEITLPFVGRTADATADAHFGYVFGAGNSDSNSDYVPSALTKVIITGGSTIVKGAFKGCERLASLTLPFLETHLGYIFGADTATDNSEFVPSSLKEVTITGGTSLSNDAFQYCNNLTSVTILDGVTKIGPYTFLNCSNLAYISIPESVISMDYYAFFGTAFYNNDENWEDGVLYLDGCLIYAEVSGSYTIKAGTRLIASYGFQYCPGLTNLIIPDSVTHIATNAFSGNYDGLQYNEYDNALYLGNETNKYIVLVKAKDKNISTCTVHENTVSICENAFANCSSLTSVVIPDGVNAIGSGAFNTCINLTSINIPEGITEIKSYTFCNCTNLKSITIPESVKTIEYAVFMYCKSLECITIPSSITSIAKDAFDYSTNDPNIRLSVYITGDLADWCKISFANMEANPLNRAAYVYINNEIVTNLVIPDTVTEIGDYAFVHNHSIKSVTIPDSVTEIGQQAFKYCLYLESVTIGSGVTMIGVSAFNQCYNMEKVYYNGTSEDWNNIEIRTDNTLLTNATRYYS